MAKKKGRTKQKASTFGKRLFPKFNLKDALQIAQKLKELNGGNPWTPIEIAKSLQISPKNNKFYYLTAASRDYGLTEGTRDTLEIKLTTLGREIVYAQNLESEITSKVKAFNKIEVFYKVNEYYKGSSLPDLNYLGNTLESQFGLDRKYHKEFSIIFKENVSYLDLKNGLSSKKILGDKNQSSTVVVGESGPNAPKLFVIMPFSERDKNHPKGFFEEVLRSLITPAGVNAGFHVETAKRNGSDIIQSTIINELTEADLVLADLTEHNPNVLFELGVRMTLNKPIVLIKSSETGKIFDIDSMLRVYEYSPNLWQSTVETDLKKIQEHIDSAWKSRNDGQTYMNILRKGGTPRGILTQSDISQDLH